MSECPRCRTHIENHEKEWNYRKKYYQVKKYLCPKCNKAFFEYFHDGKYSHTIPKRTQKAK